MNLSEPSPRWIWAVPLVAACHNLEELGAVSVMSTTALMPIGGASGLPIPTWFQFATIAGLATLLPVLLASATYVSRLRLWSFYALVVFQTTMGVNLLPHLVGAWVRGGYHPGLATALVLEIPLTVGLLSRSAERNWLSSCQWWLLGPAVLVLHGPVFMGLVGWAA